MRTFLYGLVGLILSIFLFYLTERFGEYSKIIILSTILCGCTGAIVSAIRTEKQNVTEENTAKKDEERC